MSGSERFERPAPQPSERERAIAVARHLRQQEGLTIAQIADRLGRSRSTVAGYFSDPAGEKAKRYKAKHNGRCERCGNPTAAKKGVRLCRACWRESLA